MRLILLGPPGCGKGTQADLLCSRNGMVHISTGDLLRAARHARTPLGLQAETFMNQGRLVPDELVNDLVAELFRGPNRPDHFLMDGYPRTIAQAEIFERLLAEVRLPLTDVVLIDVPDSEIESRIVHRLTCPKCKATYHLLNKPPKVENVCDRCGTRLEQRKDDNAVTVRQRLEEYHQQTADLVPHYRNLGLLRAVAGQGDIQTIHRSILAALSPQAGKSC
jgi:adenylate kinase